MGVTEGGGPAVVKVNTATATSASFTPAAGSLIVAMCAMGNGAGTASSLGAVTDSLSGTWTRLAGEASASGGDAEVWAIDAGATPAARTVTWDPGGAGASGVLLAVKYYVGALLLASQPGVTAVNGGTATPSKSVTTTKTGSLVVGAHGTASNSFTMTAAAGNTIVDQFNGSSGDTASAFTASAITGTPGATTFGYSNVTAGAVHRMAFVEILPSYAPVPRASFYRRTSHLMTR